ncbi:hypothetical protein DFH11DRAFT_113414 [Phellopilus nigrolimitatus]|nr:hypothetical protein DFH11DRAFT_113414 [Phellopilus nigrolimitatus]
MEARLGLEGKRPRSLARRRQLYISRPIHPLVSMHAYRDSFACQNPSGYVFQVRTERGACQPRAAETICRIVVLDFVRSVVFSTPCKYSPAYLGSHQILELSPFLSSRNRFSSLTGHPCFPSMFRRPDRTPCLRTCSGIQPARSARHVSTGLFFCCAVINCAREYRLTAECERELLGREKRGSAKLCMLAFSLFVSEYAILNS